MLVTETGYFKSNGNQLSYACTIPTGARRKTGVIFVHAANGNRLGPHRMFVEFANSFNTIGLPTMRFDLSGCGDSTGSASQADITADVRDTIEAIRFFKSKANLDNVILFGISRGARICYGAMTNQSLPLGGMILLSTPFSSNMAAMNSLRRRLKEYFCKLKDPVHLRKLLSGRANTRQIFKTLSTAAGLRKRYEKTKENTFATKCPVLLFYGELDPVAKESSQYYTNKYKQNDMPYNCHFIENANHSYFHYQWKEQILDITNQWLENTLKKVQK